MTTAETAASFAIARAKAGHRQEIGADDLLLGCLQTISQFGVVPLGPWTFDLEALGVDWLQHGESGIKAAYTEAAVGIFDHAARIARADGSASMGVDHVLAAFAGEESGLIGDLKRAHGITSATWRAAVAQLEKAAQSPQNGESGTRAVRGYLTPEEAAEVLGIHVQTLRAYVRSGKLPALRLAGERAIRIRRTDLEAVLEPLVPQS